MCGEGGGGEEGGGGSDGVFDVCVHKMHLIMEGMSLWT